MGSGGGGGGRTKGTVATVMRKRVMLIFLRRPRRLLAPLEIYNHRRAGLAEPSPALAVLFRVRRLVTALVKVGGGCVAR